MLSRRDGSGGRVDGAQGACQKGQAIRLETESGSKVGKKMEAELIGRRVGPDPRDLGREADETKDHLRQALASSCPPLESQVFNLEPSRSSVPVPTQTC